MAESITTPRRLNVALIVETSLAPGREIVQGIARYMHEHKAWSIYHEPHSIEELQDAWLEDWEGDGIIARLKHERIAREAEKAIERGIPVVDVLGEVEGANVPLVHTDDQAIARMVAEHLMGKGFRHFGYCGMEAISWSQARGEHFKKRTEAAGFDCRMQTVLLREDPRWSRQREDEDLEKWIMDLPKPAGVMICSDQRAQRVLEACRRLSVAVPEEVAVISCNNDEPLCQMCNPPLSSVWSDHSQIGYEAAGLLDRWMAGQAPPEEPTLLPPRRVVERRSSDTLAIDDELVAAAARFIREFACEGIGVDEIVAHVPASRSVLQRRYRQVMGRTMHEDIVNTRLKRAQQLLADTDQPIAQIARRTGVKHQEYMGTVFRQKLNITPAKYRKQFMT
ncbi:MAG: DNA-binding transcriptional regulator [Phycisphaeraceae bacterium]|nr:DNA-binding transcriptional regulator [Phycisphaeraceae bacterium]